MKRFYLSIIALMFVLMGHSQAIAWTEGYYYLVSPNAQYYAGAQEGSGAYRYNFDTKEVNSIDPEGDFGFKTNAIANDGTVAGSYGWKAALWVEGNDYELLPMPEGLTELELATNDAVAISADAKQVVVAFNADGPKTYYVYTEKEDGSYDMVKLPMPEKDPIYSMYAQWYGVKDMSLDGNTLVGFLITDDGQRQLPLVWRKKDGVWSYEFFGLNFCLKEGKTVPPYPYEWMIEDPETGELELPYQVWEEWTTAQYEAESGYYYQMKGVMMSGNGRYVALNMGIQLEGEQYGTIYAAVYDLEKDTVVVFKEIQNSTSLSVNDKGEVIVATPTADSFRWSYVVSMDAPNKAQTLTDWLKNRTSGAIDLAKYMTYQLESEMVVAEGTAYFAKEGNGLVTYMYDVFGEGNFESFFIRLDVPAAERPVYESEMQVYPNPTSGLLNVSKTMENVEIYDVIGRKVYTQSVVENVIDLSELHVGQYFLVATVDGERISTKIMIKK